MNRAKCLFEKQGFKVTPYSVDYKTPRNNYVTFMDFLPSAQNLELTENGVRELFGRLFYHFKN
jgi:uncharacterized SAM-binding protein YcdF (DUF218 family)